MNFNLIQQAVHELYYTVFLLEDSISHRTRGIIRAWLTVLTLFLFLASATAYGAGAFFPAYAPSLLVFAPKIYGVFCISLFLALIFFMMEAFYYSYYHMVPDGKTVYIDFDLAHIIHAISPENISADFFATNTGRLILLRAGINAEAFAGFLNKKKSANDSGAFLCEVSDNRITLPAFAKALLKYDKDIADFLFSFGIQEKELAGITSWISEVHDAVKAREYWWSEENLSHVVSIGQGLSYGRAYTLEKYSRSLPYTGASGAIHTSYGESELKELEAVLARKREGNAMLVGNDKEAALQIISRLSGMIYQGITDPVLKNKYITLLDHDSLVSHNGQKSQFEREFIALLKGAAYAGNIILVIPDMASFISSATGIGSDVPDLLEPYLSSPSLQIVGISDTERFHNVIEKNGALMQGFETILIKEVDESNAVRVLENELVKFENQGFFFTYPAINAIVESAERYFPEGVMPDKAIDLLAELVPKLKAEGKKYVERKDVLSMVESKTGIPVGEVRVEEKDKLLHLEDILHERIVGQDEAVKAISSAVRRARSGVTSPSRPLGSFLFLGPTGVGKTETTKALAEVFFGADKHVMRLDMSEYAASDATSKLIGSFSGKQEGVLSSMLREHQYGVLLLDEFEKTTPEVMNLFLQILDEGFFSDMSGKKIMARNLIIIATSNAGSDLIWEAVKSGNDLAESKDGIVDAIVKAGIFKPELLNRFDGVILFHPLSDAHLRKIAELMLRKLHERLAERGINLVVDQPLIDFVVSHGTDPKFGARPMNRAIQEKVEQLVAEKIIRGEAQTGAPITLTKDELSL